MARAAFAAKAQLLSRLQPYVRSSPSSCGGRSSSAPQQILRVDADYARHGFAPTDLVPEICGLLRSLSPAELRLVLSAYAGHPPDSSELRVRTSGGIAEGTANTGEASGSSRRLVDVLAQLLVGGSRLGTLQQLLEAATVLAEHAPSDCQPAIDFWLSFAERIARFSASNSLNASQMLCVFAACSTWEERGGLASLNVESSTVWGHMIRSVGGRLADPQQLDSLSFHEVVEVVRHAARLGQPQYRLAAGAGLRLGHDPSALSAKEAVEVIGAAGKLGGRLHMMTRALADQLVPQVPQLPSELLVRLCSHLGALEMLPKRLAAALEITLPEVVLKLNLSDQLLLLHASGRLRWRVPAVLGLLVSAIREDEQLDQLNGMGLGDVIYDLYRLDIWDDTLMRGICLRLKVGDGVQISRKTATNVLLALAYFSVAASELCRLLLQELLRANDLPIEALHQLKTFEMAVRVGHTAVSFQDFGPLIRRWLFGIRRSGSAPEPRAESAFADDVSLVARRLAWRHQTEVEVGPYLLDFAALSPPQEEEDIDLASEGTARALARFCVAIEADGPSHFYRPHGKPWHWTANSKLRHRLLTSAGIRVAHVPYYDWAELNSIEEKEAYLEELLLRAHAQKKWAWQQPLPDQGRSSSAPPSPTEVPRASLSMGGGPRV